MLDNYFVGDGAGALDQRRWSLQRCRSVRLSVMLARSSVTSLRCGLIGVSVISRHVTQSRFTRCNVATSFSHLPRHLHVVLDDVQRHRRLLRVPARHGRPVS